MRLVTFFITQAGVPLPDAASDLPEYAPWSGAQVHFERIQGDHAPGVVRARSSVTAKADAEGKGQAALLPGRYTITLPSGDAYRRTLDDDPNPLDLSDWLAVGYEPSDPSYETLATWIQNNADLLGPPGPRGPAGPNGPAGPPGIAGARVEPVAVDGVTGARTYKISFDPSTFGEVYLFDELVPMDGEEHPWPDLDGGFTPVDVLVESPGYYTLQPPTAGNVRRFRVVPVQVETLVPGFGADVEIEP